MSVRDLPLPFPPGTGEDLGLTLKKFEAAVRAVDWTRPAPELVEIRNKTAMSILQTAWHEEDLLDKWIAEGEKH